MPNKFSRRNFIQRSVLAGAGLAVSDTVLAQRQTSAAENIEFGKNKKVRIGFIGTGLRGQNHVEEILLREDCEVVALADPDAEMLKSAADLVTKKGQKAPKLFGKGNRDYLNLLKMSDLDAVIISSPWEWHTEQCIAAMRAGKAVGSEVGGAFSVDECWQLVNVQEETGAHFMFLENVCYRRDVLAVLNMVRQGLFGEIIHLEGGYQHDLREVKFNDGKNPYGGGVEFGEKGYSESRWRTKHSLHRNGELYPTHGIGPVAMMCDINRGNRFLTLVSMASKPRGLHDFIVNHPKGGAAHPNAKLEWKLGDVVQTMIKCANGETVLLTHDTNLARPYSLGFRVQGTRGIWMDVNKSLLLEGQTEAHRWTKAEDFLKKYDHPLWQKYGTQAEGAGHGGMDFFAIHAFIESLKAGAPSPIDVYDGATWLAITALSEASIAAGSQPQAFPDFTRGRWTMRKNEFAVSDVF
jgi:hypothetical protein